MQRLFMLSVSAVIAIYSANAIADSSHLKGTYGFTSTNGCLYASGGFNTSLQTLGTASSGSFSSEGVWTFNGDGTGTYTLSSVGITPPPTVGFLPSADSSAGGASFTFTVADDIVTLRTVPGTFMGKSLTGPRAGQTFEIEGIPVATGLISADGRTLTASFLTPGVEILTYSNGDVLRRICHSSRVYIKLDAD
jgi:hypothetical protein